jgi:hypothetical protein
MTCGLSLNPHLWGQCRSLVLIFVFSSLPGLRQPAFWNNLARYLEVNPESASQLSPAAQRANPDQKLEAPTLPIL